MLEYLCSRQNLSLGEMKRDIAILVAIVLLSGCAPFRAIKQHYEVLFHDIEVYQAQDKLDQARRKAYTTAHPELSEATKAAIERGQLLIGMSKEEVAATFGRPTRISDLGNEMEYWDYPNFHAGVEFDENGKISKSYSDIEKVRTI